MQYFDEVYRGTPPWDIGRPQPEVVRLEESGAILGRVLDLGCGTGENLLYLAARGHDCVGVDFAPAAVRRAIEKAAGRVPMPRFEVRSALDVGAALGAFDTVLDCGLFHTLHDRHRPLYARSVREALRPGGRFFVLCFSEREPAEWGGPRRVTRDELRATFGPELHARQIRPIRFETNFPDIEGHGWLAEFERLPGERPGPGAAPTPPGTGGDAR